MKTVQMTLNEKLVSAVDKAAKQLGTTRSGFTRIALSRELNRLKDKELERKHREGYLRTPIKPDEFESWETEQSWPAW